MFVRIYNPKSERSKKLEPGESMVFGRDVGLGVGELSMNMLVSRRHGIVAATSSGFSVESIGTFSGFVIKDTMTPSRLHLPQGTGPVEVPFANAVISFDHGVPGALHVEVVDSDQAALWEKRWGPDQVHELSAADPRSQWRGSQPPKRLERKETGEPYAWFWTLVAMCEGEMTDESVGVPTNADLSKMLGYSTNIIERHLRSIYAALEIEISEQNRPRDAAVRRAIDRGVVTRKHLPELAEKKVRSPYDD